MEGWAGLVLVEYSLPQPKHAEPTLPLPTQNRPVQHSPIVVAHKQVELTQFKTGPVDIWVDGYIYAGGGGSIHETGCQLFC